MHVNESIIGLETIDTNVDSIIAKLPTNYIMGSTTQAAKNAAIDGIQTDLSNATDGLGALKALIDTVDGVADGIKTVTDKLANVTHRVDYWSLPVEEVALTDTQGTKALPDVVVDDLPTGATVVKAVAMLFARYIEEDSGTANKLNGATVADTSQVIQVRDDGGGDWIDAINFVDDEFGLAADTREGGPLILGSIDVGASGFVDGNDTYNFQWLLARSDGDALRFNDVQVGLRVWYKV